MSTALKMICWASGMVEFLRDEEEPEGAILCCIARDPEAIEELLDTVRVQTVLHDFGDLVGLRVPEISLLRADVEQHGVDDAVYALMAWEDMIRGLLPLGLNVDWTRA